MVFAKPEGPPGSVSLPRLSGWMGLGALTIFLVIGLVTRFGDPAKAVAGTLAAFAAGVPYFLARPRFPLAYAIAATAGIVVVATADPRDIGWFALPVLSAWCVLSGGMAAGLSYGAASVLLFGGEWLLGVRDPGWGPWAAGVAFTVVAAALVRHQLVLVERLRAAQADLAERSRVDERNRIARELHDVIAHTLTVSLLHLASARLAVEHDPADAARALTEAERLGRQSLAEVRATMGLLRSGSGQAIASPVPGADELPRLVGQLRDAGADVSFVIEGDIGTLPATTGSTVYRITQEALTNAARHAPGSAVLVRVAVHTGRVEVSVDSAGRPGQSSGMGLLSMRERALALGGSCAAGPGGHGWLVQASLPLDLGLRAEPMPDVP
jgi:signal transduction histidine kinase